MAKVKTLYECTKCGAQSPKWAGQCYECAAWNTLVESSATLEILPGAKKKVEGKAASPIKITQKKDLKDVRLTSGIEELDRVLGGGLLKDSLVLITGNPGIGKSTLTLQWALQIAAQNTKDLVMIVSGEESAGQISERAHRLGDVPENLVILSEFLVENIIATLEKEKPAFLILDSVQTIASGAIPSAAGSVSQIRMVTEKIMHIAKAKKIPTVLVGHVTKSGEMAGPQALAHLVDTLLHLEGDQFHQFRLLRSTKNRFGSVFEVGVFEMTEKGLQEVKNPSEAFLSGRLKDAIGSIIFPTIEGTRPFLVEIQTLTSTTKFGYPKRTATGVDVNRLNLLLAILQKHTKIKLDNADVFANVVGGFRLSEPAADLAIALSLASSKLKKPLPEKLVAIGELGLSGEIRAASHIDKRVKEAEKLGFSEAVLSASQAKKVKTKMQVISGKTLQEVLKKIFE